MSKFDIKSLFKPLTEEEQRQKEEERYQETKILPERMSYWLPEVDKKKFLLIPKTQIIQLDKKMFVDLCSDKEHERVIDELQALFEKELKLSGRLFMKTGNFSDKFSFSNPVIDDFKNAGKQFYSMYYTSLMFGVPLTSEVVFRELIENTNDLPTIYDGMPLRTEFRAFYDFDTKKPIGISNYWHPDVMNNGLREEQDLVVYQKEQERVTSEFNENKQRVIELVAQQVEHANLKGKWSVDVMMNDKKFYLIDMARMETSALVEFMEEI